MKNQKIVGSAIALSLLVGLGLCLYISKKPKSPLPKDPIPFGKMEPAIYRATIQYGEIIVVKEYDQYEWAMLEALSKAENKPIEDIIIETLFIS